MLSASKFIAIALTRRPVDATFRATPHLERILTGSDSWPALRRYPSGSTSCLLSGEDSILAPGPNPTGRNAKSLAAAPGFEVARTAVALRGLYRLYRFSRTYAFHRGVRLMAPAS